MSEKKLLSCHSMPPETSKPSFFAENRCRFVFVDAAWHFDLGYFRMYLIMYLLKRSKNATVLYLVLSCIWLRFMSHRVGGRLKDSCLFTDRTLRHTNDCQPKFQPYIIDDDSVLFSKFHVDFG